MLLNPLPFRIFKNEMYKLNQSFPDWERANQRRKTLKNKYPFTKIKILKTHDKSFQYSIYISVLDLRFVNIDRKKLYHKNIGR